MLESVSQLDKVAVVGAAAAADQPQVRQGVCEARAERAELRRIAGVEGFGRVELRMAHSRGVAADRTNPCGVWAEQDMGEMFRVGAVHHEPTWRARRGGVDRGDGIGERIAPKAGARRSLR